MDRDGGSRKTAVWFYKSGTLTEKKMATTGVAIDAAERLFLGGFIVVINRRTGHEGIELFLILAASRV